MTKSPKTDVLAQPVGMEAALTEKGVRVGIRSRFLAAWDRLAGSRADAKAAQHEGEAIIKRARDSAQAELIAAAGKVVAKQFEADPALAIAVLTNDLEEASRRFQNRSAIAEMTATEILQLPPPEDGGKSAEAPERQLDDDWLNQFYNYAGSASSDDLRHAFARILAGEVSTPGTFSKRTLRSICELDHSTAQMFNHLARFRDRENTQIIRIDDNQIPYSTIVTLDDAGLIANVPGVGFNITRNDENIAILRNGTRIILVYLKEKQNKFHIPTRVHVYTLTRFGRDLCSILPTEHDDIYLDAAIEQIKKDNNVVKITKADFKAVDEANGKLHFENETVIFEAPSTT